MLSVFLQIFLNSEKDGIPDEMQHERDVAQQDAQWNGLGDFPSSHHENETRGEHHYRHGEV